MNVINLLPLETSSTHGGTDCRGGPSGWSAERTDDPAGGHQNRADQCPFGDGPADDRGDQLRQCQVGAPDGRQQRGAAGDQQGARNQLSGADAQPEGIRSGGKLS